MTGRRALAVVALAGCLLTTGCPAAEAPSAERDPASSSAVQVRPELETGVSIGRPPYAGPPPDAPPSTGPLTTLRAAVDLTSATPGVFARVRSAVAAPDGGAFVLLSPVDPDLPQELVTVGSTAGGGFSITGAVPMPRVEDVWDMHLLGNGSVAVAGHVHARDQDGYGFQVVDPATGDVRPVVVVPHERNTVSSDGRSALSPSGPTLYLFVTTEAPGGIRDRLVAVDVASGRVLADRDLADDVADASRYPVGRQLAGLVPRPDGGATLVFDASPTDSAEDRIPTLLTYDARLNPVGDPVRVTDLSEGAETQAVAAGSDGTVFLLVALTEGAWILAVPDGGGAGPVLVALEDHIYDYAMVVEPAQVWALLPASEGARAVDLTTGGIRGPLRLGCFPRLDVRGIHPAWSGAGALLIGECDSPREDTQMLWIVGP
jgi:hypothetical protein